MKSVVLYFFMLVLEILLNLSLDICYKNSKFLKTLLEKSLKFVSNNEDSILAFYLSFILLLAKIDLILKK